MYAPQRYDASCLNSVCLVLPRRLTCAVRWSDTSAAEIRSETLDADDRITDVRCSFRTAIPFWGQTTW